MYPVLTYLWTEHPILPPPESHIASHRKVASQYLKAKGDSYWDVDTSHSQKA